MMERVSLSRDLTTFRGIESAPRVFGVDDLTKLVGTTFEDKGYTSTTALRSNVDGFVKRGQKSAVIEIEVPKSSKALPLPGATFAGEAEVLINRGAKFTITSVEMTGARVKDIMRGGHYRLPLIKMRLQPR